MTSGGASSMQLPRAAKDTPAASARAAACERRMHLRPGCQGLAAGAIAHQLDHREQSVPAAHLADQGLASLQLLEPRIRAAPSARERAIRSSSS